MHCTTIPHSIGIKIELGQSDNLALFFFQTWTSVIQKNTNVMKLFQCALTLKDPSSVTVKKGILKVDNINVQVTSTLRSLN